jgi:pyruvate,water dikinase
LVGLPFRFIFGEIRGGWLPRWQKICLPAYFARLDEYGSLDLRSTSSEELLRIVENLAQGVAEVWHALALASGSVIPLQRVLENAFWPTVRDEFDTDYLILLRGFSTEILDEQDSLYQVAREASASPAVSEWLDEHPLGELLDENYTDGMLSDFRQLFLNHLDKYGHQIPSLDFAFPCLAEDPNQLSIALRCYMDPSARSTQSIIKETEAEREAATQKLRDMLNPVKRTLFNSVLGRAQDYVVAREKIVFYLQMAWPIFRKVLLEIGNRLSDVSTVERADDVFFLTFEEVSRHCASQKQRSSCVVEVLARRRLWQTRRSFNAPTSIPPADDAAWRKAMRWPINLREIGTRSEQDKVVLLGTPASPGQVRARARILAFPSEFARLTQGEVLVTVATTPSWTPLFSRASAVVTDVGAVSSHSSIVAREYRIPAVVGTQQATRVIRDGQFVIVDGTTGKVFLD